MGGLNWPWIYLGFLLGGTGLCLGMLFGISPDFLNRLAGHHGFSPNWVTIWRMPIVALGEIIYIHQGGLEKSSLVWLLTGFLLVVAGLTLDRLDGRQAKAIHQNLMFLPSPPADHRKIDWAWYLQSVEQPDGTQLKQWRVVKLTPPIGLLLPQQTFVPMFRLVNWSDSVERPTVEQGACHLDVIMVPTGIGEWLDPLVDKVNFHPIFLYQAALGNLNFWVVILMFATDLFGTVIRSPFDQFESTGHYLRKLVVSHKASAFGKIKVVCQFATLVVLMPVIANWLSAEEKQISYLCASTMLLISLISGILSVLSRLAPVHGLLHKTGLTRLFRDLNKGFEH